MPALEHQIAGTYLMGYWATYFFNQFHYNNYYLQAFLFNIIYTCCFNNFLGNLYSCHTYCNNKWHVFVPTKLNLKQNMT